MNRLTFQIRHTVGGWYWRIVAKNGRVLVHSETYVEKRKALHAVNLVIREAVWAKIK